MSEYQINDVACTCQRAPMLAWMASLSVAAGEIRAAEGYLLELLAWCAFGDRPHATNPSA